MGLMFGIQAGRLDTRAAFSRRAYIDERERGEPEVFLTVWAQYVRATGREQVQAGRDVDFEPATLRIRDSAAAREISSGDRVTVHDRDHRITSVSLPGRSGLIELAITTDLGET